MGAKYIAAALRIVEVLFGMRKVIGYMLTWTTYGTWLQGDKKGWIKDGEIRPGNENLKNINKQALVKSSVKLNDNAKQIVKEAIEKSSEGFGQKICAIAVCSNHVHLTAEYVDVPISVLVGNYKAAARKALKKLGYEGKVWTGGYDKRYCFDEKELRTRIDYVNRHK